ncbi:MAG: type II secretion system protein [Phycisphaerales bacterium]|nr:type II secretion system protein [Phycisphaerales bacterium]
MGIFPAQCAGGAPCRGSEPRRGGFTLIELLVVVAVIAILLALSLPMLSRARRTAQTGQSLQRIRDCALANQSAVTDNQGRFRMPEVVRAGDGDVVVNAGLGGIQAGVRRTWVDPDEEGAYPWSWMYWFSTSSSWPVLLQAYLGYEASRAALSPNSGAKFGVTSDYWLTHTIMAEPEYFTDNLMVQVSRGVELCRSQQFSKVRSPARKVFMLETAQTAAQRMAVNPLTDDPTTKYVTEGAELVVRPMAFFDLHVEQRRTKDAGPHVQNSMYGSPWSDLMNDGGLTTLNGIQGWDY